MFKYPYTPLHPCTSRKYESMKAFLNICLITTVFTRKHFSETSMLEKYNFINNYLFYFINIQNKSVSY